MPEERIPSSGTSGSRWPVRSRDWTRQPVLVKQLLFVSVAAALLLPLLYLGHLRHDGELLVVPEAEEIVILRPNTPALGHDRLPSVHHSGVGPEVDDTIEADFDGSVAKTHPTEPPHEDTVVTPETPLQPLTFALIMWSEHSASEGVILLKVSRSQLSLRCL